MEHHITSTDLARKLGDVLERVRHLGDSFTVVRDGDPVARLVPLHAGWGSSLREGLRAWSEAGAPDADFADALDRVAAADREPEDPWSLPR
jgi:prevent-host-death family protein